MYAGGGVVDIRGCLIAGNLAQGQGAFDDGGAGLYVKFGSSVFATNCTIVNNAQQAGGVGIGSAVYDEMNNGLFMTESIVWGNSMPQTEPGLTAYLSCIQDTTDISLLHSDPLFVDFQNGDYRLQSGSPCIDRGGGGQLTKDLDGLPRRIKDFSVSLTSTAWADLGAYEHPYDCNGNQIPDYLEVQQPGIDLNANGNCDECEPAGSPFCFGDGTAGVCPCGNLGALGSGCRNSSGAGGRMRAIGNAQVSWDTLLIHVDGLGATAPALYFQGTNLDLVGGASGVQFGDGLRCVYGNITRLPTRSSVNGQSSIGAGVPGDQPISVMGSPVLPGTRYYQAWYRDVMPYCTSAAFNLTNALQVTWTP